MLPDIALKFVNIIDYSNSEKCKDEKITYTEIGLFRKAELF